MLKRYHDDTNTKKASCPTFLVNVSAASLILCHKQLIHFNSQFSCI